jgi:Tol biopolymer transport system component
MQVKRTSCVLAAAGAVVLAASGFSTGHTGSSSGLYVVNAKGGRVTRIVAGCVESFAWSPDGRSIALARLIHDNAPTDETVVLNVQSGRTRFIAPGGRPEPPAWSPDGSKIALGADDSGLYVVSSTGGRPKKLPGDGYWPDWSRDGKRIAYSTFSQRVAFVKRDGSGLKYLTSGQSTGLDVPVRWLPDGRRLVFAGPETKTGYAGKNLLLANANKSRPVRLAVAAGGTSLYAVAPRSGLTAYSDGKGRIFVVKPDGSGSRLLASGSVGGWSPNGRQLVYTHGAVYVISANGTGKRKIASQASVDGIGTVEASWSSRGQIAFILDAPSCGGPS